MEYKNYWGISEDTQNDLVYTDSIYKIMDEQCTYLFQHTKGKIFAVFSELKIDGSLFTVAKSMSNIFKSIFWYKWLQETIAESSTKNLN